MTWSRALSLACLLTIIMPAAAARGGVSDDDRARLAPLVERLNHAGREAPGEAALGRWLGAAVATPEQVADLKSRGLGYGHVAMVLAFAQQLAGGVTDANIATLLGALQGPPASWPEAITATLGLEVGPVIARLEGLAALVEPAVADVERPIIREVDPPTPVSGGTVRLKGKNFGTRPGTVQLQPTESRGRKVGLPLVKRWTETEVEVLLPIVTYPDWTVTLSAEGRVASDAFPLTIALLRTDRRYDPQFYTAVEYTLEERDGKRNFSGAFPHIGLRIGTVLSDRHDWGVLPPGLYRGFFLARLASTATQQVSDQENVTLSAERTYGVGAGVSYYPPLRRTESEEPYGRLQLGLSAKLEAQTVATRESVLWRSFYGLRMLHAGRLFNGTYLDIGVGESPQFIERRHNRFKLEGFLPVDVGGFNAFLTTAVESDFGSAPDLVSFSFGTFFNVEKVTSFLFSQTPP